MAPPATTWVLLVLMAVASAQLPPSPPTSPPLPPSPRDPDWVAPFQSADLLYQPGARPDFEALLPIENCTESGQLCTALWWPGLGNGFLGGIAQGPTLRISGYHSGYHGRYTAGKDGVIPPVPFHGFSNKEFAYRASIPALASSIVVRSDDLLPGSSRAALNTRDAVYFERSTLSGGGNLELRTYFHQTRRNLIVVEVQLNCSTCTKAAEVSLSAFSRPALGDVSLHQHGATGTVGGAPQQLLGVLRAPENCEPSNSHLYDTNQSLGYVHDVCPPKLTAKPGNTATVQLLSVLTLSSEEEGDMGDDSKARVDTRVVSRALKIYQDAKTTSPTQLLDEHRQGWAALWDRGGIELETEELALQQTTNASLYYLLMSTRPDWLYSTLVPSTIAASAPKPHGCLLHAMGSSA